MGWKRDLIAWSNLNRAVIRIGVSEFGNFFVTLPGLNTGIYSPIVHVSLQNDSWY